MKYIEEIQRIADYWGFGITKEFLATKIYREMRSRGYDCAILNERYLIVEGEEYQFIKSHKLGGWVVKAF